MGTGFGVELSPPAPPCAPGAGPEAAPTAVLWAFGCVHTRPDRAHFRSSRPAAFSSAFHLIPAQTFLKGSESFVEKHILISGLEGSGGPWSS